MFIVPLSHMTPLSSITEISQSQNTALSTGVAAANIPFADVLADAVNNARETQKVSNEDAYKLASGNIDSLEEIMINSSKASIALDTTIQLTTRAVNAYKEIMQMQV